MGGTFDEVAEMMSSDLVRGFSMGTVWVGVFVTCTLLGPEGPGADR
jgi:hypothetical protein